MSSPKKWAPDCSKCSSAERAKRGGRFEIVTQKSLTVYCLHGWPAHAHFESSYARDMGASFHLSVKFHGPRLSLQGRLDATQSEQERAELNPWSLLANMTVLWFLLELIASILLLQTEIKIPNPQRLSHNSLESKEEGFSLILSPPKRKTDREEWNTQCPLTRKCMQINLMRRVCLV